MEERKEKEIAHYDRKGKELHKEEIKGDFEDIGYELSVYDEENNLFFYPIENSCNIPFYDIEHLHILEITKSDNPYCIQIKKGKAVINIKKAINSALVEVK